MRVPFVVVAAAACCLACSHELSSEERLERATRDITAAGPLPSPEELAAIRCNDLDAGLIRARNIDRPEAERLEAYGQVFATLKERTKVLEDALARNPDLSYREGSEKVRTARDTCVQQTADVRMEFERYVRELVDVPIVQEVRGGKAVSVPRISFPALRRAIDELGSEDREALLQRVTAAERRGEARKEREDTGGSGSGKRK